MNLFIRLSISVIVKANQRPIHTISKEISILATIHLGILALFVQNSQIFHSWITEKPYLILHSRGKNAKP